MSSIYMVGNTLNRALPFLLLPLLTRWLTTDDYGVIGTFNAVQAQVALAVTMAVPGAIGRAWLDRGPGGIVFPAYLFNGLIVNLGLFLAVGAIFFVAAGVIAVKMHLVGVLVWITWVSAFFSAIHAIKAKLWIFQEQPKQFSIYQVTRTAANLILSIGLLYYLWMDWRGRIGGIVLVEALTAMVCFYLLFRQDGIHVQFRRDYLIDILKFSLPMYPHALGMLIITGADKFFLISMEELAVLGVYNVAFAISSMILFLAGSIDTSLMPWINRKLKAATPEDNRQIYLVTYGCAAFYVMLALALGLVAEPLLSLMVGKAFHGAAEYIMVLSLAHSAGAAYRIFTIPIFYAKKTGVLAWITMFSGMVTMVADYLLIGRYGAMGAAWGVFVGYATLCLGAWYYARILDVSGK
ncbi:MAG: oligosaccharide flippase family protein [Magnetococcales bacterium]|nr:oligosaccharide flippase family protein [Magnetococcales bacterium]MBF0148967.1 oligosaccharide flippase family protein [Magnetococcales bacterium]MBF0603033.1 oligosaccharide flippase family protein [Magnetococcales bacterium]